MKIKRLFIMLLICMGVCDAIAQTTLLSKSDYLTNFFGDKVIVRNYQDSIEVICAYGEDGSESQSGELVVNTTFFIRHLNNGQVVRIGKLPALFYVNDVRFVSLYNEVQNQYVDLCVFCGRRDSLVAEYYLPSMSGPGTLVRVYDTAGIVGLFYMDAALSPATGDSIWVRKTEGTKELTRLTAYAESNGHHYNSSHTPFRDNAVLDVIGTANSQYNYKSCLWRVKFYPQYNNYFAWDNNIRKPNDPNEKMVDIVGIDKYIVTVSKYRGNDKVLWLRCNEKETTLHYGGLELTNIVHQLNFPTLNTIAYPIAYPNLTRYQDSVLLCALSDTHSVVSFRAINEIGGVTYLDGICSYRIKWPQCNIVAGAYDKGTKDLCDIVYFPLADATATLSVEDISTHFYGIHILPWGSLSGGFYFTYVIKDWNSQRIQSIATYKNTSGQEYLHMGGCHQNLYDYLKLMEHRYFTSYFNRNCFTNDMVQISSSSISSYTFYDKPFPIKDRFQFDTTSKWMTARPMTSVVEPVTNICTKNN